MTADEAGNAPAPTRDLRKYGYTGTEPVPEGLMPGRVVENHKLQYKVITAVGELSAIVKGSFHFGTQAQGDYPCVGDFVLVQYNGSEPSLIARLLPRKTYFSRADYSGHLAKYAKTIVEQVIAANIDTVFIITSLNKDFKINRIERYVTLTRQSGAGAVILLTKADLTDDPGAYEGKVRAVMPDIPVHAISNVTRFGYEHVYRYLAPGTTTVFLGMSGVGKSSLLNSLIGYEAMIVKEIREDDSRGRHTTTHRQLFTLPSGAMVIDTPGMRELGLFNASDGIGATFADIAAIISKCRFSDCRHGSEPGCAVNEALGDGSLPRRHWENYLAQLSEMRFVDDKSKYMRERNKKRPR